MPHSRSRLAAAAVAVLLGVPGLAHAAQSPVLVAVSTGATADSTAQFVAIKEYSPTTDLTGWSISVQGSSGTYKIPFADFKTNPQANANGLVLVATGTAASLYSVVPSVIAGTASLAVAGGRVCLVDSTSAKLDCVAWGQYTPSTGNYGPPVTGGGQLETELERIQFTGVNATDWTVIAADPSPFGLSSATDGGTPDGSVADGGVTDGGTTDGGVTDGGTTDGGVSDGGAGDGGGVHGSIGGGSVPGAGHVPTTAGGCSCSTAGGGFAPGLLLALIGLLVLKRRRPVDPGGGRR